MRVPVPYSPTRLRDDQERGTRNKTAVAQPCLICGRWIADPDRPQVVWIEIDTSSHIIVGEADAADSQGSFPVGANCTRVVLDAIRAATAKVHA